MTTVAIIFLVTVFVTLVVGLIWVSDDLLKSDVLNVAELPKTECPHNRVLISTEDPNLLYMFCGLCNTTSEIPKGWHMLPLRNLYLQK